MTASQVRRELERLDRLARLFDSRFQVPGTGIRFGLDAIAGLVPGVGDLVGLGVSAYIILRARRLGAPRRALFRMLLNAGVDALVGTIPLLGDVFDIGWRANRRNVQIARRHLVPDPASGRRIDASAEWR